ncbi:MAG: hypothetical protein K6G28_06700 [Acholeplasmatales bacterium]|nr:hypothetical protein [Acholeplasmatales bacterium]
MITVESVDIIDKEYEIEDFGNLSCDPFENQKTIQYAIDSVSKLGGGHLNLIPGIIETGPICMRDNVDLHIPFNCYLKFVKKEEFYHTQMFNYEGMDAIRTNSPISIHNCTNVAITGSGVIDGCGDDWRPIKDWKLTPKAWQAKLNILNEYLDEKNTKLWYPSLTALAGAKKGRDNITLEESQQYYDFFRPVLLSIYKSNKVLIQGITSSNSPAWNIHPLFSTNVTIDSVSVKNEYYAQNGDGIDIESCTNVEVKNSNFAVGDDGICLKSGKNKEARKIAIPCSNIYIHDNVVYHAHGGIVIGSEMSRGVNNVYADNNTFIGTDVGLRFKSSMGRGGVVEDIHFDNISMIDLIGEAIIFDLGYSLEKMKSEKLDNDTFETEEDIPYFKDITVSNSVINNCNTFLKINGINEDTVSNIHIENVSFKAKTNFNLLNCKNIEVVNVTDNNSNKVINEVFNA